MATAAAPDRPETGPDLPQADVADVGESPLRATRSGAVVGVDSVAFLENGQARPGAQAAPAGSR